MAPIHNRVRQIPALACALVIACGLTLAHANEAHAAGDKRLLVIDTQRHSDVPRLVPKRITDYLVTIMGVEDGVKVFNRATLETASPPPKAKLDKKIQKVVSDGTLDRADKALDAGKTLVSKRKYMKAVKSFTKATTLYKKRFDQLENFDKYVDALLSKSLAYFKAGYDDNGEDELGKVLTLRPTLVLDKRKDPSEALNALKRLNALYSTVATGPVVVESSAPGAQVYLDGNLVGAAPQTITGLFRGAHVVRVVAPGHHPWAKEFAATKSGSNLTATLNSKGPKVAPQTKVVVNMESVDGMIAASKTGNFAGRFRRAASGLCKTHNLDGILMTYVRKTPVEYELAPFLFGCDEAKLAELDWLKMDADLSAMQIGVVDLSTNVIKALKRFPNDRAVAGRSPIYKSVGKAGPAAVIGKVDPLPKDVNGGGTGTTGTTGGTGTVGGGTGTTGGTGTVGGGTGTTGGTGTVGGGTGTTGGTGTVGGGTGTTGGTGTVGGGTGGDTVMRPGGGGGYVPPDNGGGYVGPGGVGGVKTDDSSWYEEWWVWTLIGGAVVGGTAAAILLNDSAGDDPNGFRTTVSF